MGTMRGAPALLSSVIMERGRWRPLAFPALASCHPRNAHCHRRRTLLAIPGAALAPGPLALGHARPGEFLGEWQQRVSRAGDNVACDIDDPLATGACHGPELLKRLPRPDPVPFGQHADCLLNADPDGQGAFQLAHSDPEPPRLIAATIVVSRTVSGASTSRARASASRARASASASRPSASRAGRTISHASGSTSRTSYPSSAFVTASRASIGITNGGGAAVRLWYGIGQLSRDQVGEDHRTRQVRYVLVAYAPPGRGTAQHGPVRRARAGGPGRLVALA